MSNSSEKPSANADVKNSDYNSNNCNCKTKINCPMNGMCILKNVVYQATIFTKENVKDKKITLEFRR